jgi:site-specific DNA recombinase
MAKRYRPVDRDQSFLLPPDMREWLPEDHLAWLVIAVIAEIDTTAFHARPGRSWAGRSRYDPDMMLTLLVYAYANKVLSSRRIEALCAVDVAFRLICAGDAPDHVTLARFRRKNLAAFGDLFARVLVLCAQAGMARVGTVAIDGTKIAANASGDANRTEDWLRAQAADIAKDMAAAAEATDDRPGLDALRDAAEAGLFEAVWCLSPDRLARAYAYQVLVLDELTRFGVKVHFSDAPDLADDDPQAVLLTQVQGVIAEYEKAKIAERYRRGKLFRARAGEITTWKAPYGYRRIARSAATGPAHLEIYEPEAAVVRRIFTERAGGTTIREICRQLNTDAVPSPTGRPTWGHSTLSRLLRNEAFLGRVYYNRTETVAAPGTARRTRQVARSREEWISIDCPALVTDEQFQAASRVAHDNSQWSPRRAEPGQWLLKGLVKCGACRVGTNCHKMRGRNGTWHRYYYCRNHDPLRAGGEERRCPERNIRADALDEFVFDHVRAALTEPAVLLAGEQAIALTQPIPDDELLAVELARLDRKIDSATAERRRLVDLFQAGLIEMPELQRRSREVAARHHELSAKRNALATERTTLAHGNLLRQRMNDFAQQIRGVIDQLDRPQRQQLMRLLIEDVHVTGSHVQIQLRIPLDPPDPDSNGPHRRPGPKPTERSVSSQDRLRSLGGDDVGVVDEAVDHGAGDDVVTKHLAPAAEHLVAGDDQARPLISAGHQLEEQVCRFGFERDVAHLVDDQARVAAEADEFILQPACVMGGGEPVDPLARGREQHPMPGLAGTDRQTRREMRFPGPRCYQRDLTRSHRRRQRVQ